MSLAILGANVVAAQDRPCHGKCEYWRSLWKSDSRVYSAARLLM